MLTGDLRSNSFSCSSNLSWIISLNLTKHREEYYHRRLRFWRLSCIWLGSVQILIINPFLWRLSILSENVFSLSANQQNNHTCVNVNCHSRFILYMVPRCFFILILPKVQSLNTMEVYFKSPNVWYNQMPYLLRETFSVYTSNHHFRFIRLLRVGKHYYRYFSSWHNLKNFVFLLQLLFIFFLTMPHSIIGLNFFISFAP